jgi:hypothetical protein
MMFSGQHLAAAASGRSIFTPSLPPSIPPLPLPSPASASESPPSLGTASVPGSQSSQSPEAEGEDEEKEGEHNEERRSGKSSLTWQYFDKAPEDNPQGGVRCKLCSKRYAATCGTGTLNRHLEGGDKTHKAAYLTLGIVRKKPSKPSNQSKLPFGPVFVLVLVLAHRSHCC